MILNIKTTKIDKKRFLWLDLSNKSNFSILLHKEKIEIDYKNSNMQINDLLYKK